MFKVKTLNKISELGLAVLPKADYDIADAHEAPDAVLVRSANMLEAAFNPELKCIARAGAGVNNIPLDRCSEAGIVVFNTPGANANGVKELVIASMLISSRKIVQGINWAHGLAGNGAEVEKMVEKGKSQFEGPEIKGKRLGVIGLGAIGVMVANDALALGMDVIGYDPFISVDAAWGLSREVVKAKTLDELLMSSDYITIHTPLNDKTKGMFNAEKFAIMKSGVRIINLARGGLINNNDIKQAIKDGKVSCYVTDFPSDDLLNVEGVIPVPHLGASTPESEENCAVMAAQQMKDFLEKGTIRNSVNFPAADLFRTGAVRMVVAHANIPNMVGQITGVLAANKLNISDMLNHHREHTGYTIIDLDSELPEAVIETVRAIEGIRMVRVIR